MPRILVCYCQSRVLFSTQRECDGSSLYIVQSAGTINSILTTWFRLNLCFVHLTTCNDLDRDSYFENSTWLESSHFRKLSDLVWLESPLKIKWLDLTWLESAPKFEWFDLTRINFKIRVTWLDSNHIKRSQLTRTTFKNRVAWLESPSEIVWNHMFWIDSTRQPDNEF